MKQGCILNILCLVLAVILSFLVFTGCTNRRTAKDSFDVITSFYPMYVFTKNIADGAKNVTVKNMTPADTGCLHDYQLMPRDLKMLEKADLLVINGAGMESFMDKVIGATDGLEIVDTSENENIKPVSYSGEENPHIWLYIRNAIRQIDAITDALCLHNPENTAVYLSNRSDYVYRLNELDHEFGEVASKFENNKIVTTHSSFDYMAFWYNMDIVGTVLSDHNQEPSAAELSELIETARRENAAAIFREPNYPETAVNTISAETGIPVYTLDPMVTGTEGEYKDVYENVMRNNLDILKEALK